MTRSAELSEAAWARIEPLMPQAEGRSRPWRDLPERFGPWQTVWKRHHRFATDGTWDMLLRVIQSEADAAGRLDWSVSVDSSIVRAHQPSARAATNSKRMAALSTMFEPALLKRVKNFSFRGCIRRPLGDPSGPTVPPYTARRRFARRLSVHSGR